MGRSRVIHITALSNASRHGVAPKGKLVSKDKGCLADTRHYTAVKDAIKNEPCFEKCGELLPEQMPHRPQKSRVTKGQPLGRSQANGFYAFAVKSLFSHTSEPDAETSLASSRKCQQPAKRSTRSSQYPSLHYEVTQTIVPQKLFSPPGLQQPTFLSPHLGLRRKLKLSFRHQRTLGWFLPSSQRSQTLPAEFGSICDLRSVLGLDGDGPLYDTTLVAIDTESERTGFKHEVVEVGITILNTRDIRGIAPGVHGERWMRKAQHHHLVIDITRYPRSRMRSSLFGPSRFLSPSGARARMKELWKSLGPNVAVVGHSVLGDLKAVANSSGLQIGPQKMSYCFNSVDAVYDTFLLAQDARELGLALPSLELGQMLLRLGPSPQYASGKSMLGCHNASNDAAYSMMAALLLAVRYDPAMGLGRKPSTLIGWLERLLRNLSLGVRKYLLAETSRRT